MENRWKIIDLPSKFFSYKDKCFFGRALTVLDLKYLSSINPENYEEICNDLLLRCIDLQSTVLDNLNPDDRLYLLFWIRSNSFTKSGFDIEANCPFCNSKINTSCSLEELNVKYIKPEYFNKIYDFPKSEFKISIKIPTIKDNKDLLNDNYDSQILKLASYVDSINDSKINLLEAYQAINSMDPIEFRKFSTLFKNIEFGIDNIFQTTCPKCKKIVNCDLDFSKSIFSDINLLHILEVDIKISKYSNRPIQDNDPWIEIELRQEIINKLVEEEQEEIKKLSQNKNSLSRISSPQIPKMPKIH
jgi:hypothetical protein